MARHEKMKLGAFIPGALNGSYAWRQPGFETAGASRFAAYKHVVQLLEAGKFDTIFMNDGVGVRDLDPDVLERNAQLQRWDPLTLLPALAVVTERIGLIATANTSYNEPFTLARRLASLDEVSDGRAGWNMVTSLGGGENYNRDDHMLHAERYERAEEFIEVITGLWDSWDDDAAIRDKPSGRWLDAERMHLLNHRGRFFTVRGPLNAPRSPQGYPVVAQAGASDAGKELAARTAELIFTAAQTIEEGQDFVRDIVARAARHGRGRDSFRILPGVAVTVARSMVEAESKYDRLHDTTDPRPRLKAISRFASLGVELSEQELDEPARLPDDIPETNTHRSRQKLVVDLIRREGQLTLRQLARRLSAGGHRVLIGTPESVADEFQRWFEADAADGFNIMFPAFPESVEDFVTLIVPELQRRGLFRLDYEGRTLRENLGLQRPSNRHLAARIAAA